MERKLTGITGRAADFLLYLRVVVRDAVEDLNHERDVTSRAEVSVEEAAQLGALRTSEKATGRTFEMPKSIS